MASATLARLHLGMLAQQLQPLSFDEPGDRRTLRLDAQATLALLVGADTVVSDCCAHRLVPHNLDGQTLYVRVRAAVGLETRFNAGCDAGPVPIAAIKDSTVEMQRDRLAHIVRAYVGDKLVKLLPLDQRPHVGNRMLFDLGRAAPPEKRRGFRRQRDCQSKAVRTQGQARLRNG